MASNPVDDETRDDDELEEDDQRSSGNWLGRWVLIIAIVAFLLVYVVQLTRGSSLPFTVLLASGAMGVVGIAGLIIRRMLLRTASNERAAGILNQMERMRDSQSSDSNASEGG